MIFSIIIPVKNRADLISETLDSLKFFDKNELDIIIIDNNSKDNLENLLKEYPYVRYFKNNCDMERSYSRNLGIKHAKGEYITFLDSDDKLDKEIFKKFKDCLNYYSKDSFFFINFTYFSKNKLITNLDNFKKKICTIDDMLDSNIISNIGIIVHRDLANKILWDENKNIIGSEDYDFVLRLILYAKRAVLIESSPLGYVRQHEGRSVFNDKKNKIIRRFIYLKKKIFTDQSYLRLGIIKKNKIIGTLAIYTSLLLVKSKFKKKSVHYLIQSIKYNYFNILSKRFLYICYYFIFK